jgi:hypothetical protein
MSVLQEARRRLALIDQEESSADLPPSVLPELTIDDVPDGTKIPRCSHSFVGYTEVI